MGLTLAQKILKAHLVCGEMVPGQEIGLRIDPVSYTHLDVYKRQLHLKQPCVTGNIKAVCVGTGDNYLRIINMV